MMLLRKVWFFLIILKEGIYSSLNHHHLCGGCCRHVAVFDISSVCRPALRPPSGLSDGGVETFSYILTPPSSWSASPPPAINNTLINCALKTVMPFHMPKVGQFALNYSIKQPILFYISKLLKDRHVCSFLCPWHSKYSSKTSKTFHLKRIDLLFGLLADAPCLCTICCDRENERFQKL